MGSRLPAPIVRGGDTRTPLALPPPPCPNLGQMGKPRLNGAHLAQLCPAGNPRTPVHLYTGQLAPTRPQLIQMG